MLRFYSFLELLIKCWLLRKKEKWTLSIKKELICENETSNRHGKYAIEVVGGQSVAHILQLFPKMSSFILLSGSSMKVHITGKLEKQRGNGLKFLAL